MNPTARVTPVSLAVVTTIVLSGCASSLSGVGSTENYACKAPIGAQCTSVSGVYANATRHLSAKAAGGRNRLQAGNACSKNQDLGRPDRACCAKRSIVCVHVFLGSARRA